MTHMLHDRNDARTVSAEVLPDRLRYSTSECALGHVLVARSARGVCAILIGDGPAELEDELASRFPVTTLVEDRAAVRDDLGKVVRFMGCPADGLDLTLDVRGTPFQRRVWEALREVPSGGTISYAELARRTGPLSSPRAVAGACAANGIALAIPCHRVIRSDGSLSGYCWGPDRKQALLDREREAA